MAGLGSFKYDFIFEAILYICIGIKRSAVEMRTMHLFNSAQITVSICTVNDVSSGVRSTSQ